jgi:hypothetical protein
MPGCIGWHLARGRDDVFDAELRFHPAAVEIAFRGISLDRSDGARMPVTTNGSTRSSTTAIASLRQDAIRPANVHVFSMSRAFVNEEHFVEDLPDRPVSEHPITSPNGAWR